MNDDLLQRLGQLEREQRLAPHWDEVLEGRRLASALVDRRRSEGAERDELEAMEALAEACRPLRAGECAAWAQRLRVVVHTDAPPRTTEPIALVPPPASPRPSIPSRLVHFAAVAAIALLWVWARAGGPAAQTHPHGRAALPPFSLVVRNATLGEIRGETVDKAGDKTSDEPILPRYRGNSWIHWMIAPQRPIAVPAELAVAIEGPEPTCLRRLELGDASADGVFELRGRLDEVLDLRPGRWTLTFVVAPRGVLWSDAGVRCASPGSSRCPCPLPPDARPGSARAAQAFPSTLTWVAPYALQVDPPPAQAQTPGHRSQPREEASGSLDERDGMR